MALEGFLQQVVEATLEEISRARSLIPLKTIRREAETRPVPTSFLSALAGSTPKDPGIIAEIKRASPSKGDIRPDLDVKALVEAYEAGGARAVSVLTEPRYFKGSLSDLETACRNTSLPVLRKDFILSDYQIFEAKNAGASAVLLITTLLSLDQQTDYAHLIRDLGMEPLVEIHSEREFEKAYKAGAKVVGINNRNLATLDVDPGVARRVAKIFPQEIIPVEASGISSREEIEKGLKVNIFNFLVGESIVKADDTQAFIKTLCQDSKGMRKTSPREKFLLPAKKPFIKICGLTRPDNALACAQAGADAIGLVFFDKSPRNLTLEQAGAITRVLPPHILTCGVFVDESFGFIMDRVDGCGLKRVQLHGHESPELTARLAAQNLVVIKALFSSRPPDLTRASLYPQADFFLVEQGLGTLPGGNALEWDYGVSARLKSPTPVMLAGGLCCENIQKAISLARPMGVDVSSGVEETSGLKDMDKVRSFIYLARSA